ncbi:Major facilitator superfamily domain containing protein [Naviculisporaceae sp. PSN 640]
MGNFPATTQCRRSCQRNRTSAPRQQKQRLRWLSQYLLTGTGENQRSTAEEGDAGIVYLHGLRFNLLAVCIAVMLFLTTIETSIATTSLPVITRQSELGGFERASWIMSSYFLGYVAVIVIFAKLSDICGRKLVFVVCIVIFTAFSGGCAAAQSLEQLITLRALQGLGAGGCFALCAIIMVEIVPPNKYGALIARIGISIIIATVLGPIVGGEISTHADWRWIFMFNVPIGITILTLALLVIPNEFPYHGRPQRNPFHNTSPRIALLRLDLPGFVLLMLATLSFTACFQEADTTFPWDSAYVVTLLVASVLLWVALLLWERYVTRSAKIREPVLPWRFFTSPAMVGILIGLVLTGCVMSTVAFQLPVRYQMVNGLNSTEAGVRVLPFGAAFPVGMIGGSSLGSQLKIPGIYLVMFGTILQIIGCALLGTQSTPDGISGTVYGSQVIVGVGCGMTYQTFYLLIPFTAVESDKAVGMGAGNQFRMIGSAFGLSITTSVFNTYTRARLSPLGINDLSDIPKAAPSLHTEVMQILSDGYNRQMLVLCGFAAAQLPAALLLWRRKQILTV